MWIGVCVCVWPDSFHTTAEHQEMATLLFLRVRILYVWPNRVHTSQWSTRYTHMAIPSLCAYVVKYAYVHTSQDADISVHGGVHFNKGERILFSSVLGEGCLGG